MKKILIISDTHSGHKMALTPPEYQTRDKDIENIVAPFWDWFTATKKDHYDILLHVGDAIEGDDHKDAGFLLEPDLNKQIDIASAVIESCNADKHYFVSGTPYHTATGSMDIDTWALSSCHSNSFCKRRLTRCASVRRSAAGKGR